MFSQEKGKLMNVYVENIGYRKLNKLIKKFTDKMPEEPIDLHVRSYRRTSLFALILLVAGCKSIRSIELTQEIRTLSYPIILFANAKNSFKLQLVVSNPMTTRYWKKINRLKGVINVLDVSNADNSNWYKNNRNVILLNNGSAGICDASVYSIVSGAPDMCCETSSCLGKNLYISDNGDLSFCPKNPSASVICNINTTKDIFDNLRFRNVLESALHKRASCVKCKYVSFCKGGCILQSDCTLMSEAYDLAINDIQNIIQDSINLSTISLYKERAVLYYLLRNSGDIDKQSQKGGNVNA